MDREDARDEAVLAELQAARDGTASVKLLAELRALEAHRKVYKELHPAARLDREDPDVDRLIEALAFFSLRTRQAVQRNLRSTFERLFRGYFDFLLMPLASMGMVQAVATAQRAEPAILPRGSEFVITAPDGVAGVFRTVQEVRILPVKLRRVRQPLVRPDGGYRLILEFAAPSARLLQLGVLRLHINYLDDYVSAARILHQLRVHTQRASIIYDRTADAETFGEACELSYGAMHETSDYLDSVHPIEQIRRFFHFPEQELYLNIHVPPSTKAWTRFSICLDLSSAWPRTPHLNNDVFQLFVVPALNLRREFAQPIVCDGTQDSYPIRHPNPGREFELRSIKGIFELTPKGLEALPPGDLPTHGSAGVWEVEDRIDEHGHSRHELIVRMPDAFAVPRKLAVDAYWYQPAFTRHAVGSLQVKLQSRHLDGIEYNALGGLRPEQQSPLREDFAGLLQILALKMKPTLGKQDIISLFHYMGTVREGPYKGIANRLLRVDFELMPDSALRGAGVKHVYSIDVDAYPPEDEALMWNFLCQTMRLLDCWNHDATVDLDLNTAGSPMSLPIQF